MSFLAQNVTHTRARWPTGCQATDGNSMSPSSAMCEDTAFSYTPPYAADTRVLRGDSIATGYQFCSLVHAYAKSLTHILHAIVVLILHAACGVLNVPPGRTARMSFRNTATHPKATWPTPSSAGRAVGQMDNPHFKTRGFKSQPTHSFAAEQIDDQKIADYQTLGLEMWVKLTSAFIMRMRL